MARNRQIILMHAPENDAPIPLGTKREVLQKLAKYNTAPDGSPESLGMAFGPGIRIDLPMVDDRDEINQAVVSIIEEEIAWPVLSRLCKQHGWQMADPETGRTFGAGM
ncbi:MAG: hypothetical protein EA376_02995 [Phycisphaeraceae bacterium]|nr:MAG: hypothetical protein EA376_02995 [Phycisphaeraceae bacterium]